MIAVSLGLLLSVGSQEDGRRKLKWGEAAVGAVLMCGRAIGT